MGHRPFGKSPYLLSFAVNLKLLKKRKVCDKFQHSLKKKKRKKLTGRFLKVRFFLLGLNTSFLSAYPVLWPAVAGQCNHVGQLPAVGIISLLLVC